MSTPPTFFNTFFKRFKEPTVFFIGAILLLIYSIIGFFYYLPQNGGESMVALFFLVYGGIALAVFTIDWGLVLTQSFKKVLIIELLLSVALFIFLINSKGWLFIIGRSY